MCKTFSIILAALLLSISYDSALSSLNKQLFINILYNIDNADKNSIDCLSNNVTYPDRKLLHIPYCENLTNFVRNSLPDIVNQSSKLFIIVINMDGMEADIEAQLKEILDEKLSRPIIVYLYRKSEKVETIWFIKKGKSGTYVEDYINWIISSDYNVNKTQFYNVHADTLKDAMNSNCSICIRLSYLISNIFVKYCVKFDDETNCNSACFKALLDLPYNSNFTDSSNHIYKSLFSYYIGHLRTSSIFASKISQNYTVDDFLNQTKFELPLNELPGLAWRQAEYEVFDYLIRNDFEFPKNFIQSRQNDEIKISKNIKNLDAYINELEDFHRNIQAGNYKKIEQFLNKYPNLAFARNLDNKSALKAAYDGDQMEMFAYLKSGGMSFGSFQEQADYYKSLNALPQAASKKKQIFQFNRKFWTSAAEIDPITKILQKSRYIYDHRVYSEDEMDEAMNVIYSKINETCPELLDVVANTNQLEIIFDFLNSNIVEIMPDSSFLGISNGYYNYIVVAAKDFLSDSIVKYNFVLATVAHELMHYAMHQLYENDENPFDWTDNERQQLMLDIRKKYEKIQEEEPVINGAYEYDENQIIGELIVRVPDMLTTYRHNQTHIQELKTKFEDLFKFYYDLVLPDMRDYMLLIDVHETVREVNNWLDLVAYIQDIDFKQSNDNDEAVRNTNDILDYLNEKAERRMRIFTVPNADFVLKQLNFALRQSKVIAVYMYISFSQQRNFEQVMSKLDAVNMDIPLIVFCDRTDELAQFSKILLYTTFVKIVVIRDMHDKLDKPNYSYEVDPLDAVFLIFLAILIVFIFLTVVLCFLKNTTEYLTIGSKIPVDSSRLNTISSSEKNFMS